VKEVDVEFLHGAVPGRISDEGTTRATTAPASHAHPLIIVADVATIDVFDAPSGTPHLVPP
jgi:hypothetical protein